MSDSIRFRWSIALLIVLCSSPVASYAEAAGAEASAEAEASADAEAEADADAETRAGSAEQDVVISDEVVVVGEKTPFAKNLVTDEMIQQQSAVTSVTSVVDNLPGVLVNEGDVFGADDWSTTISVRGFQNSLDEQQLGITIDGLPNGNSNYGGGSKANRFIDAPNLGGVEVYQGTADIASRSNEALGGTLNFITDTPLFEKSTRFMLSVGDFDAQKLYARYDTGAIGSDTFAWVSFSTSDNNVWIDESGEANREHFAGKVISDVNGTALTGYLSWDDVHEDNYQRITPAEFLENPDWDRLTGEWTGIPFIDQLYRRGWSTLRENLFGYLRADFDLGDLSLQVTPYYHQNEGRGDWVPPYLVNVTNDFGGPESELGDGTVFGGPFLGQIFFVDANGQALSPTPGCVSSITFPYGGSGPESDPACYPAGAIPVGSYRHTHYYKERWGLTADFDYVTEIGGRSNTLRGGLWYEDYHREEFRDWHRIIDSRVDFRFDDEAYWVQYDREFPVDTMMFYLQDTLELGPVTATVGLKKFFVDLDRVDNFQGGATTGSVSSDSDLLISGGLTYRTNIEGLELFAGYAENFAAIKDGILERDASALDRIEPETATNIDLGLRYVSSRAQASIAYYDIQFDDRITFIAPDSPAGIDFLIGTNGTYLNVGGIESTGFELAGSLRVATGVNLYGSYTANDSQYVGSGSVALDLQNGITPGNTVFGSVEDQGVLSLDWTRGPTRAGLSAKWVGERWLDPANLQRLDDYWVADLFVSLQGGSISPALADFEFHLTVNNILDERYLGGVAGGWGGWIGGPRTAVVTLTSNF